MGHAGRDDRCQAQGGASHPPKREGGERAGQLTAEAKDINPPITTEVTEEVKEDTAEVVEKAPFLATWEK